MDSIIVEHFSSIGSNHIKLDKVCEDSSSSYQDDMMRICVVADGHGSDDYPRTERGSKYAVEAAIESTKEFVHVVDSKDMLAKDGENLLIQLEKNILVKWYTSVEEDFRQDPFSERELEKVSERYKIRYLQHGAEYFSKAYGTTLILFARTKEYSFGIQIGDGKCVVVDKTGRFTQPIPWDDNCEMNVTTSICDSNAIEEFRHKIFREPFVAVFCGSDGIDDSYVSDEQLHAFYRSIIHIFTDYGYEIGKSEIEEYLPILSKQGSGDDVSIAYIIDMDQCRHLATLLDIQVKLSKLEEDIAASKQKIEVVKHKIDPIVQRLRFLGASAKSLELEIEMNKLYQQFCKLEEERKEEAANLEADKEEREKLIDRLTREEIHLGCGITKTEEV